MDDKSKQIRDLVDGEPSSSLSPEERLALHIAEKEQRLAEAREWAKTQSWYEGDK